MVSEDTGRRGFGIPWFGLQCRHAQRYGLFKVVLPGFAHPTEIHVTLNSENTMRRLLLAFLVWALTLVIVRAGHSQPPSADMFAAQPEILSVRVSPDARHVAMIRRRTADDPASGDMAVEVQVFVVGRGFAKPAAVQTLDNAEIIDILWANDTTLLIFGRTLVTYNNSHYLGTRTFAFHLNDRALVRLFSSPVFRDSIFQHRIVSYLPHKADKLLMVADPSGWKQTNVYEVDMTTGQAKLAERHFKDVLEWSASRSGAVRLATGYDDNTYTVYVRRESDDSWSPLYQSDRSAGDRFRPVDFIIEDAEPAGDSQSDKNLIIVRSNHETGRTGLYTYDLSKKTFVDRLFLHDRVDLGTVLINRWQNRLIGVRYHLDGSQYKFFDDGLSSDFTVIQEKLGTDIIHFVSTDRTGETFVLYSESGNVPGRYYLYSRASQSLVHVGDAYPELDGANLAQTQPLSYTTRDGLLIDGYLTLPYGVKLADARAMPAVLYPHGGPNARDYLGYDPIVQFLASRGYAVLQMNFRGSTGYGKAFRQMGYREWGQAMQDDITDGGRALVDLGVADRNRLCIVGGSYGGYAALIGAAKTPDLYLCAASINGVADFGRFVRQASRRYGDAAVLSVGDPDTAGEILDANSPLALAERITVPVLLIHGGEDDIVPVVHSRRMARALKRLDKDHTYVEIDSLGHQIRTRDEMIAVLEALDRFLQTHLPVSPLRGEGEAVEE